MKNTRFYLFIMVLLVGTLLAACGDNTATTAPTTTVAPVTTSAATTTAAPAGIVATATPRPAIITPATPVTTNDAKTTTVAPTTTTIANSGNNGAKLEELNFSQLPASFTRFPLTPALLSYLNTQLKDDVLGKDDAALKAVAVLGTDESSADVAGAKLETTLRAMGYSFAIPGYSSMLKLDTTLLGAYSKAGNSDLILIGVPSADFLDNSSGDPLPAELANFAKGKKFVFVAITGAGLAAIYTKDNIIPPGMPTVGTK